MRNLILKGLVVSFAALVAFSAHAEVPIAVVGPMTGSLSAYGEQMKKGAEAAVADINAAGGINGEKIILIVADDDCDPDKAVAAANKVASKGVKFVTGHFCGGSSIPASKVYEEKGILQISPATSNPDFTNKGGWNVARYCGRDDTQGILAADYIKKNFAGQNVAVIDDGSAYGKGLADVTRYYLQKDNFPIALSEPYNPDAKDYTALVTKLKDAGVAAVYIGGYYPEAATITRQLAKLGTKVQILSGDGLMAGPEFLAIAGKAGKGVMFTAQSDMLKLESGKTAIKKFKTSGHTPQISTLVTYATVQGYAAAVNATKTTDSKKVAEWLRAGNPVDTVIGTVTLDNKGDVKDPKYVWYRFGTDSYAEVPETK